MSQALYRKWRPQKWDEVIGQPHIIQTLKNAVAGDRVAHAYLFAGPRGTGKTTAARLLAKAVNCLNEDLAQRPCNSCENCKAVNESRFLDLIEIDAASQTGVEDVRDLRDKINFTPNQGRFKIYIIDEVHMFSNSAFNALLKTLEEPPPHAIFILATTEIHKIPATVLSRCQRHEFRRVPLDAIVTQLESICRKEKVTAEPEALMLIARQSAGGMRDAISLLDQLASTGGTISLELAQAVLGTATSQTVLDLIHAVAERNPHAGMDAIHTALDAGADARLLARQVVDYLRALLLLQMGNGLGVDLSAEVRAQASEHARLFTAAGILQMIKAFNIAAVEQRGGWQPSLPLELALAEVLQNPVNDPVAPSSTEPKKTPSAVEKKEPSVSSVVSKAEEHAEKAETGVNLEKVLKAWKQVRSLIKPNQPSLEGLLNSCVALDLKKDILQLGFSSDILVEKAGTAENLEIIQKAIHEVLGVDLEIRCVVSNAKQSLRAGVKSDGMVAAALKAGGEIVDIQD